MKFIHQSIFPLVFALFLLLFGSVRIAPPDQAFYYAFAQSMLTDLDFVFDNEYACFPFGNHETYLSTEGYPANDWPMGTGICWIPFLALAHAIRFIGDFFGILAGVAGIGWFDKWVVTLGASILYGGGTLWLSYLFCRNEGLNRSVSLWATALMAGGSTLTYHLYVNSADSHPPSAFFIVLFLVIWQGYRLNPNIGRALLAGCAIGMAGLIRPHNFVFLMVPFLEFISGRIKISTGRQTAIDMGTLLVAAFFVFLPQLIVWKLLYGSWLAIPRSGDVLWAHPELYNTLFSDYHGMISWSPLFGLGIAGLLTGRRWLPFAVPVLIQIYIYSCNLAWWSGGSFGNRRMVGCVPLLILGLAVLFNAIPKYWIKGFTVLAALWTLTLLLAEVGGAIHLDRYQPWKEMFEEIPGALLPGLMNHFTNAQWGEHGLARIIGFMAVTFFLGTVFVLLKKNSKTIGQRLPAIVLALILSFNLLCAVAALRSSTALQTANVDGYKHWDRFTWVVYYEKAWFKVRQNQRGEALESFLAAAIAEERHPQAWTFASLHCYKNQWPTLAYHIGCKAFVTGQRSGQFLEIFGESILARQIERNDLKQYLYFNERGVVRALRKRYNLAEADFKKSLSLKPGYEPAVLNLQILEDRKKGSATPFKWQ